MALVFWPNLMARGRWQPIEWTDERMEFRMWTMDLKAEAPQWVEDPKSPMVFNGGWVFVSRRALPRRENG